MRLVRRLLAGIDRIILWSIARVWPLLTPEQQADIDARIKRYAEGKSNR